MPSQRTGAQNQNKTHTRRSGASGVSSIRRLQGNQKPKKASVMPSLEELKNPRGWNAHCREIPNDIPIPYLRLLIQVVYSVLGLETPRSYNPEFDRSIQCLNKQGKQQTRHQCGKCGCTKVHKVHQCSNEQWWTEWHTNHQHGDSGWAQTYNPVGLASNEGLDVGFTPIKMAELVSHGANFQFREDFEYQKHTSGQYKGTFKRKKNGDKIPIKGSRTVSFLVWLNGKSFADFDTALNYIDVKREEGLYSYGKATFWGLSIPEGKYTHATQNLSIDTKFDGRGAMKTREMECELDNFFTHPQTVRGKEYIDGDLYDALERKYFISMLLARQDGDDSVWFKFIAIRGAESSGHRETYHKNPDKRLKCCDHCKTWIPSPDFGKHLRTCDARLSKSSTKSKTSTKSKKTKTPPETKKQLPAAALFESSDEEDESPEPEPVKVKTQAPSKSTTKSWACMTAPKQSTLDMPNAIEEPKAIQLPTGPRRRSLDVDV